MSEYIIKVCKIAQGDACCRYLIAGAKGFECGKVDPQMKKAVDDSWKKYRHVAQGDNCEGRDPIPN